MNVHTAHTELKARSPKVNAGVLAVEAVVMLSVSFILVGFFA